jgi:predicted nucleotidyltransferase
MLDRRFGVDALWIFGSEARGEARADSDVDLAALFRTRPDPLERLDARAEAAAIVGREVDLVDLDVASPILARAVLTGGRPVGPRDERRVARLVAHTIVAYDDLRRVRRPIEEALRRRLAR